MTNVHQDLSEKSFNIKDVEMGSTLKERRPSVISYDLGATRTERRQSAINYDLESARKERHPSRTERRPSRIDVEIGSPESSRRLSKIAQSPSSSEDLLPTQTTGAGLFRQLTRMTTTMTANIQPAGESGRQGFHPFKFIRIIWRSTSRASRVCNVLWPIVPVAITLQYARPDFHVLVFVLNYFAMVPCANLIGFAGQEMSRKLHKVFGVLLETTLGSLVEIVMFMVLIRNNEFRVIKAAILGSVLATQLLCLGTCFLVGGARHNELEFSAVVGEVGSDLLLTAGFALIVPAAFHVAVSRLEKMTVEDINHRVLQISRITSCLLILAFIIYMYFQIRTNESIYDAIFWEDEQKDNDRHKDADKAKLTFTECMLGLVFAISVVAVIAVNLVEGIPYLVENRGVSEAFVGLILVPLVEKFAEHLTAIDEAWDNQMNMALAHVLGSTIQTSLFNGPLVVLVGWALNKPMDLNFDIFNTIVLILAILVVGNFLRDQKSNYLEGALCVIVYFNIASAVYVYPNELSLHSQYTESIPVAGAGHHH